MTDHFSLTKHQQSIQDFNPQTPYDLIYFDAFGPTSQPELWTAPIFKKLFSSLNPGGFLVTFCAKGSFKRTLKTIGFQVECPAGPPGKREMTRAIKPVTMPK
jgi:tRNA U34 5-methylaminomethyl-2-thiouridine-forming methyltransferase MnmC